MATIGRAMCRYNCKASCAYLQLRAKMRIEATHSRISLRKVETQKAVRRVEMVRSDDKVLVYLISSNVPTLIVKVTRDVCVASQW